MSPAAGAEHLRALAKSRERPLRHALAHLEHIGMHTAVVSNACAMLRLALEFTPPLAAAV
jgi:hypothetical protein